MSDNEKLKNEIRKQFLKFGLAASLVVPAHTADASNEVDGNNNSPQTVESVVTQISVTQGDSIHSNMNFETNNKRTKDGGLKSKRTESFSKTHILDRGYKVIETSCKERENGDITDNKKTLELLTPNGQIIDCSYLFNYQFQNTSGNIDSNTPTSSQLGIHIKQLPNEEIIKRNNNNAMLSKSAIIRDTNLTKDDRDALSQYIDRRKEEANTFHLPKDIDIKTRTDISNRRIKNVDYANMKNIER